MSNNQLLEEVEDHQSKSKSYLDTVNTDWRDYESMLIGSHRESLQNNNSVYDPRIGTIELERTSRVMAQNPTGQARPVSSDDVGKTQLMNMLLTHQIANANEQFSFLLKLRMLSLYSRVYGTMFALTPWRVSDKYIGPELNIISIWDAFPQPNVQVRDADWFVQQHWLSVEWLLKQDPEVWNMEDIKALARSLKEGDDEGDIKQNGDEMGEIEQELTPSQFGDAKFPKVKAFTEYRNDKWITWTPQRIKKGVNRPYMLRVVKRNDLMLPVVAKQFIPTTAGPIGIGPFQRGKSIQFATNQLINLHLSGVKSSVFPEQMINPNKVVPNSIKYGAAEKWFMENPGQDVVAVQKNSEALNVFNSTYGMLIGAAQNAGGSVDQAASAFTESTLGKTPQAIQAQAVSQSSMDEWEEVMLQDTVKEVMIRWMQMNSTDLESGTMVRLFGNEIDRLMENFPDAKALVDGNGVFIDKTMFQNTEKDEDDNDTQTPITWDYQMEVGAMSKPDPEKDKSSVNDLIKFTGDNPVILELMARDGKTINMAELMDRAVVNTGIKDVDRIIVDVKDSGVVPGDGSPQEGLPQEGVQPDVLGGINGIPPQV